MHKNYKIFVFALMGAGLMSQGGFANPIQFSITGTADSSAMGYTLGQICTFSWVLNDGYADNAYDTFNAFENRWTVEETTDPMIWSSISGDGLTGTYSRPSGTIGAPYESLVNANANPDMFNIVARNEDAESSSFGLTANGVEVSFVGAYGVNIGADFAFSGAYSDPTAYWSAYTGNYIPSGGIIHIEDESFNSIDFTATSVSIEAVPEPASVMMIGLGGLVIAGYRRIRKMYGCV